MLIWNLYKIRDKSRIASLSQIPLIINVISSYCNGTNTTYLSNVVNHYFKCNYKHLLNKYRILHAKHLIDHNECDITELDKRCGFTSRSVFYDAFGKIMGIPPAHYRKRREKAAETCSGLSGTMENSLGKNEIHQQQVI